MVQPFPDCQRDLDDDFEGPVEVPIERRPAGGLIPALAAAAIIIGGGVCGVLLLMPAESGPAERSAAPNSVPASAAAGSPAVPAVAAPVADAPGEPMSLGQQAIADQSAARKLVGRWVPQLFAGEAARSGDDETRLRAQYRALRERYPEVVLVRSDDYRSFAQPGRWVVLLARSFPTAAAANAWCARQGLAPDDCFAKRLSRTSGPRTNTVARR